MAAPAVAGEHGLSAGTLEPPYTVDEISAAWKLSRDKVQRIFQNEPGVVVLEGDGVRYGKRRHRTLRVPASVAERVHRRLSVVKGESFRLPEQQK